MFEFSFEDCNSLNISERLAPALTFNRCIFFLFVLGLTFSSLRKPDRITRIQSFTNACSHMPSDKHPPPHAHKYPFKGNSLKKQKAFGQEAESFLCKVKCIIYKPCSPRWWSLGCD